MFSFRQDELKADLNIQDDITSIESVNLCVLLVQAVASAINYQHCNWIDYIKEKELDRHFNFSEE